MMLHANRSSGYDLSFILCSWGREPPSWCRLLPCWAPPPSSVHLLYVVATIHQRRAASAVSRGTCSGYEFEGAAASGARVRAGFELDSMHDCNCDDPYFVGSDIGLVGFCCPAFCRAEWVLRWCSIGLAMRCWLIVGLPGACR